MAASLRKQLFRALPAVLLIGVALIFLIACTSGPNRNPTGDANPPGMFPGSQATEQGSLAASLYGPVFLIATAVFVLVEGLVIFIALRFRRRRTDTGLPVQTHGNKVLEIAWTLIPALIVTGLFVLSMVALVRVDARSEDPAVVVDVTGFQWQWTFEYPDYTNTAGRALSYTGAGQQGPEMVLPVGETIRFRLHSNDVIHSFYVPQFFFKRDVIPGRVNEFEVVLKPEFAGQVLGGQCAEFCGLAHADMYFTVRPMTAPDFDAWVAAEVAKADVTPPPQPSGATALSVTSVGILEGFDPATLEAPADTPLTIMLQNADQTAPHDFAIKAANPDGSDWNGEPNANPGETATYQAPPLAAGTYQFYCSIHPNMVGTLNVGQ